MTTWERFISAHKNMSEGADGRGEGEKEDILV